jgi:tetratricopeptide (TPR) repeat protein
MTRGSRDIIKTGQRLRKDGKPEDALSYLRSQFKNLGTYIADRSSYHATVGDCYRVLGNIDKAQQSYRHALNLNPANAHARTSFAIALLKNKEFTKAETQLRIVLDQKPEAAIALSVLTKILMRSGRHEEGLLTMQRYLEIAPDGDAAEQTFLALLARWPDSGIPQTLEDVRLYKKPTAPHTGLLPACEPERRHSADRQP